MDKMPSPRPAGGTREALPSLAQHLMKTYGSFVPGDISVRLNFAESVFTDPSHPDHPIARTTWIHESHHYKLMVGTTWGLTHLRYTRSWANLGIVLLAEQIVPAFRQRGELVPYPLQRFCAAHASHPLAPFVHDVMRPFSEYTDSLYYELGLVPSFTANGRTIPLPSLSVDEDFSVPFGVWWLLETAARIEDRWRNKNDFTEKRWRFMPEYDFIWQWAKGIGLPSPLYLLPAIDIALNPVLPYDDKPPAFSLSDRLAHVRFELITRLLYDWQEKGTLTPLPKLRPDGWYDRSRLDEFVLEIQSRICELTGWATPVQAFRYLTGTSGWAEYGITPELIAGVLARRERFPSDFACQTLSPPVDDFFLQFPPRFIIFTDGARSTIKDAREGTFENLRILRKAVTEQIICDAGTDIFVCPFCHNKIRSASDHGPCSANMIWPLLQGAMTFPLEALCPLAEWQAR